MSPDPLLMGGDVTIAGRLRDGYRVANHSCMPNTSAVFDVITHKWLATLQHSLNLPVKTCNASLKQWLISNVTTYQQYTQQITYASKIILTPCTCNDQTKLEKYKLQPLKNLEIIMVTREKRCKKRT